MLWFGGTFAVDEEAVSCMKGEDRIADHQQAQTEIITAVDMSCLMHLDGIISRKLLQLPVMHIAEGTIGVAENGVIWVDDHDIAHRAALFLTQHLVLIIKSGKILNNLNEASSSGLMDFSRFGCWISGPSKTADIEQALVIGAHGARTLDIIVILDE